MTLQEARDYAAQCNDPKAAKYMHACYVIAHENADQARTSELLELLRKAAGFAPVAEMIATALYVRTGRKRGRMPYEDYTADYEDWRSYIEKLGQADGATPRNENPPPETPSPR